MLTHILGTPGQLPGDMSSCFLILLCGHPLPELKAIYPPLSGRMVHAASSSSSGPWGLYEHTWTTRLHGGPVLADAGRMGLCRERLPKLLTRFTAWFFLPKEQTLTLEITPIRD